MLFLGCIKNQYSEDKFYTSILTNLEEFTNFAIRDGLIFFKSEGMETVVVPDVQVRNQNIREALVKQGHSILSHLNDEEMATYMRDQVWWK